jgi:glutamyl-tRNA synthetase
VAKLRHFNGEYIRALSTPHFIEAAQPWLAEGPWEAESYDPDAFEKLAPLVEERVTILSEVPGMVDFLFLEEAPVDDAAWDKAIGGNESALDMLASTRAGLAEAAWDAASIRTVIEAAAGTLGLKLARAQAPVRVAVTGRSVGPPLFESIEVLGRDRTVARLDEALRRLEEQAGDWS